MNIEWKTDQQIDEVNKKLQKHGLKTRAKKGEKNSQYLDRLVKELNPKLDFGHLQELDNGNHIE